MTLRFSARFHPVGIKAIILCRKNQPNIWRDLCEGLLLCEGLVGGVVSMYHIHHSNKRALKVYCADCERIWTSQFRDEIVPVLQNLFGCDIKDTIYSYVGLYPTYLRSIRNRYFLLPFGVSNDRIREIIIHELSHFFCYKAGCNCLTSDMLWRLSEQIVPYILKYQFNRECKEHCYAGEGSILEKKLYCSWAKMEIPFDEFLIALQQNG